MARVSFTGVWDQTRAFVAKELSLLAPVALSCFALPLLLFTMIMPEPPTAPAMNRSATFDARILWLIPLIFVQIFGWMTLVSLALVPAISVGEGLRRALAGGSVMLLIGRMAHSEALGRMLASLLEAIVVSLWQMVTVIYVAFLYRAFAKTGKAD
jgi:hypothetical protein